MFLLSESLLCIAAFVLALAVPRVGENWFLALERGFAQVSKRHTLSVLLIAACSLGGRLLLLPVLPVPEPAVHDEFSYLLAADTFVHGRLTNPTHPMWVHFETFHVNQRPTYTSMYYPAQGLFLALGQVVFGHPYWGVWLSTGLLCGGICWMLQAWIPPEWALLGGLLAVIRIGSVSYWMNSYWGGSVAALGGALVLGALPRMYREARVRDSVLMGIGFAIIANSRPYEGLFFAIPILIAVTLAVKRWIKQSRQKEALRVAVPLVLIFTLTLSFMGLYFWRTTGSPIRTPYAMNLAAYRAVPLFPWQQISNAPLYRHSAMRDFYTGWAARQFEFAHSHPGVLLLLKAGMFWCFFVGPLFTLPLFALALALPYGFGWHDFGKSTQFLLIVCASALFAAALPVCFDAHYLAPITCAIYALMALAMRRLRQWSPAGRPLGRTLVRLTVGVAIVMFVVRAAKPTWAISDSSFPSWCSPFVGNSYRAEISSQLAKDAGTHLVLVRYGPEHSPVNEWVYNAAEIDDAKIVWARDMGAQANRELLQYFNGRQVWIVEPDKLPPHLIAYRLDGSSVVSDDTVIRTSEAQ